jgi:uncharacterized OsmC-like protein
MTRCVTVSSGSSRYLEKIAVGSHVLQADEPVDVGGNDEGPNPYELLLSALGACTAMTVRMYAERKKWPLEDVQVRLTYAKVHADDCATCESESRTIDQIELEISFRGSFTEEQRNRLMEIAGKCPVHRTLTSPIRIRSRLATDMRVESLATAGLLPKEPKHIETRL